MKNKLFLLNTILFVLVCFDFAFASQSDSSSFAVVELFTSEGCSSCVPAEGIFKKIVASSRQKNLRIYPLAFHVDYWNSSGWRDPFSQKIFTTRQNEYARLLKTELYTPQVVVNGFDVIPGYDEKKIVQSINEQLNQPALFSLNVHAQRKGEFVLVSYLVDGSLEAGDKILCVLVERGLKIEVATGENAGRTLKHENVVRSLQSTDLMKKGQMSLSLSKISDYSKASLIVFVQNNLTLLIKSAEQIDVE